MTLPADYARCIGVVGPARHAPNAYLKQCHNCKRRILMDGSEYGLFTLPPPFNADGTCPERIAPTS